MLPAILYMGFGGQLPWTAVMVYLPVFDPVFGGPIFSLSMAITSGAAGNVIRLFMIKFGRNFSPAVRIVVGSISSALFVCGFMSMYLLLDGAVNSSGARFYAFWLTLAISLFGGIGNSLVSSTGYAISSQISKVSNPVANNVYFFGQAIASLVSWPVKAAIELWVLKKASLFQPCLGMIFAGICTLLVIPMYTIRIDKVLVNAKMNFVNNDATLSIKNVQQPESVGWKYILRSLAGPVCTLWLAYFATGLVSPGQIMRWPTFPSDEYSSQFLANTQMHRSLCIYTLILAEAFGKAFPIMLTLVGGDRHLLPRIINSKLVEPFIIVLAVGRIGLIPLFVSPPETPVGQIVLIAMFGISQGIAASLALSVSTRRVSQEQSDIAGYVNSFTIVNGLFFGFIGGLILRLSQD